MCASSWARSSASLRGLRSRRGRFAGGCEMDPAASPNSCSFLRFQFSRSLGESVEYFSLKMWIRKTHSLGILQDVTYCMSSLSGVASRNRTHPSIPKISTSPPSRPGIAFSILSLMSAHPLNGEKTVTYLSGSSLCTCWTCTAKPPAVLSFRGQCLHLKCFAFWCCIRTRD